MILQLLDLDISAYIKNWDYESWKCLNLGKWWGDTQIMTSTYHITKLTLRLLMLYTGCPRRKGPKSGECSLGQTIPI